MNIWIPEIGDLIGLDEDWTFSLHRENRNNDIINALDLRKQGAYADLLDRRDMMFASSTCEKEVTSVAGYKWKQPVVADAALYKRAIQLDRDVQDWTWPILLPNGTVLRVDRIYVRKGSKDFSSLSFYIEESPRIALNPGVKTGFKKGRLRFWARLDEVNQMIGTPLADPKLGSAETKAV